MVKITNGRNTFTVTNGAYESIYKGQGFSIIDEKKQEKKTTEKVGPKPEPKPVTTEEPVEETVSENEADDLLSKPVSQWSKNEVKKFAADNGIDISGTKNVSQAKDIIKEYLDAAE
jgi:pyruvate/2-oxoglutarate dehydrogenase complex dihydrolipoamide acyltransferase (E2) component